MLKPSSTYECIENHCTQAFPNLDSLKKHVMRKHLKDTSKKLTPVVKNINNTAIPEHINNITNSDSIEPDVFQNVLPVTECRNELDSEHFSVDNAIHLVYQSAINFTISLHNNNNFSRKDVVNIQKEVSQSLIKPITDLLTNFVNYKIKDPLLLSSFHTLISAFSTPFKLCSSEYMLNKWLTNNNLYSDIHQFTINNEINLVSALGETTYSEQTTKGILMSIDFQFKSYFEHNDNLLKTLTHYDYLIKNSNGTDLEHFVQGTLWKEKIIPYNNKIVIPYFLYIDDFEVNNPLSSHSFCHSICAIYYSFPLSDQSKLTNIFIAALLKSVDVKNFGNDLCLKQLINHLNKLEVDGLPIKTSEGIKQVYFVLGLVVGDNLGLNCILEFSKSFSANYF